MKKECMPAKDLSLISRFNETYGISDGVTVKDRCLVPKRPLLVEGDLILDPNDLHRYQRFESAEKKLQKAVRFLNEGIRYLGSPHTPFHDGFLLKITAGRAASAGLYIAQTEGWSIALPPSVAFNNIGSKDTEIDKKIILEEIGIFKSNLWTPQEPEDGKLLVLLIPQCGKSHTTEVNYHDFNQFNSVFD